MMEPRIVVGPEEEPVTITQIKDDLRVTTTLDDVRLKRHIVEARQFVERRVQMTLILQTLAVDLDAFPDDYISLSCYRPIVEVLNVVADDVALVVDVGYSVRGAKIYPVGTWPDADFVTVTFKAGYANADSVPGALKAAIRLKVAELYDGQDTSIAVDRMISSHMLLGA